MIVLDTQVVVWLNQERDKLSQAGLRAIRQARTKGAVLAIADFSLLEFAMLLSRERIKVRGSMTSALQEIHTLYTVLPITPAIAEASVRFSDNFPKDPADRVIAATALVNGAPLITSDRLIRASGEVPCIW